VRFVARAGGTIIRPTRKGEFMSRKLLLAGASAVAILVAANAAGAKSYTIPGMYTFTVPTTGEYAINLVGASGGSNFAANPPGGLPGGLGAEVFGDVMLQAGEKLVLYVGDMGRTSADRATPPKAAPAAGAAVSSWGSAMRAAAAAPASTRPAAQGSRGAGVGLEAGPAGEPASMGRAAAAEPSLRGATAAAALPTTVAPAGMMEFPAAGLGLEPAGYFRTAAMGAPLAA
jgi:hypothetical protein